MKNLITFAILIFTVFITSCSSPDLTTPEGFAKEVIETLKNNDVDGFLKLAPTLDQMKTLSDKAFGSFDENKFNEKFIKPMSKGFKRVMAEDDVDWSSVKYVDAKYKIENNIKELGGVDGIETLEILFKDKNANYSIKLDKLLRLENWLVVDPLHNIRRNYSVEKTAENTAATIAAGLYSYFADNPNSESSILKLKGGPGGEVDIFGNSMYLPEGFSFRVTSEDVIVSHKDGTEGKCRWK